MNDIIIKLVHLYPKEMNIYGDTGNRLVLQRRLEWRGINVQTEFVGVGQALPADTDILLGGGGQDAGQTVIEQDLATKAADLKQLASQGVVMLMVCGMYQLFGRRFVTNTGVEVSGIGLLPLETTAGPDRLVGNTVYKTAWGEMVGYENHSGLTVLDPGATPLGKVLKGYGNNRHDKTEGCVKDNIFGTYSHGPVLSKNPRLADELISRAVSRKLGQTVNLPPLDDQLELLAAQAAKQRSR